MDKFKQWREDLVEFAEKAKGELDSATNVMKEKPQAPGYAGLLSAEASLDRLLQILRTDIDEYDRYGLPRKGRSI
ncbi:MAG TPA: hypothetical protein VEG68_13965 [Terriglobales bacterium]|nr:hypothetical protein [Terriglobales bacterium]